MRPGVGERGGAATVGMERGIWPQDINRTESAWQVSV